MKHDLTPEETKQFSKVAKDAGMSLDELIRALLEAYAEGKQEVPVQRAVRIDACLAIPMEGNRR